jgi:hypothetical protein
LVPASINLIPGEHFPALVLKKKQKYPPQHWSRSKKNSGVFFLSFLLSFLPSALHPHIRKRKRKRKEETSKSESQLLCKGKWEELFQEEEEDLQSPSHPITIWSGLALNCISVSQ